MERLVRDWFDYYFNGIHHLAANSHLLAKLKQSRNRKSCSKSFLTLLKDAELIYTVTKKNKNAAEAASDDVGQVADCLPALKEKFTCSPPKIKSGRDMRVQLVPDDVHKVIDLFVLVAYIAADNKSALPTPFKEKAMEVVYNLMDSSCLEYCSKITLSLPRLQKKGFTVLEF